MKTKILLFLLLLPLALSGKEVPADKAKSAATNFLIRNFSSRVKGTDQPELSLVHYSTTGNFGKHLEKSADTRENLVYIFNTEGNNGFVVVSGDDGATPVLGYSFDRGFDPGHVPDNFRKWLEGYKNQIRYIRAHPEEASPGIKKQWESLVSGSRISTVKSTSSVEPLITTRWNQAPYFNDLCPYDGEYEENSVTGCVATAMAQIMKYWEYPETGTGFHSYDHSEFGVISANFGSTRYDWSSMPDIVDSENLAVATLMFHCGVSVDMEYSAEGSGAYVVISESPVENCSEFAFEEYFGYDVSVSGIIREDYSTEEWINLLKEELEAGRPVEYAGFGTGGGHAFVCDGFDSNDFFHFNWGWGGYYDGYFQIDALDPEEAGTGGGTGGYNSGHMAVIGIAPPAGLADFDLALYDEVTISEDPLFYSDPYTIHSDIGNYGETTFTGDYCTAVFDADDNFVEFTEILEGVTLEGGMHYADGLDFTNPGSLGLLPGDYVAGLFYRPVDGNWIAVDDGSYSNFLSFNVYYSSDIELYDELSINVGTTILQDEPFTVTTDIMNDGETNFTGEFAIDLYDLEGEFAAYVQTLTGAELEPGYFYPEVVFSCEGVSVDPGTYLMALTHKADGGDWILSGSSYYTNPIKVIIARAPLDPDSYEANDTEDNPFLLDHIFTDNHAHITTEGSNSHTGSDLDFYRVSLEEGYSYAISARVHDSYNSGNEQVYTNDVLWSYSINGKWSEVYDDIMPGNFRLADGSEIVFAVAPYYEGETGTYLLEVGIDRAAMVSAGETGENSVKIYPNPALDILHIESSGIIEFMEIYDLHGRLIRSWTGNSFTASLDISDLGGGIYMLHLTRGNHTAIHKIIKQ